ncbi:Maf family protein [Papillibacter cinnamivorans]|uniref:dTTP/UTP pyrophosphatase n=1 Tax=Papillibacter cinnamivorans DSM 12816 TaxID=1122930 RepID=A0A1W2A895_9FIRM|nr:septum formation protein [Papillibacter cinnamivorans DSM 12816]
MASASPRRSELLMKMGLSGFRIAPPDIEEKLEERETPEEAVRRLSREKAAAAEAGSDDVVIAADTMVCCEDIRLGKPKDGPEAFRMLRLLSGRRHQVYTAVTVAAGGEMLTETERTDVYFRKIEDCEIEAYIRTGEPMDKAGAYAAQGLGAVFVERIEGDFFNVMGLPVCRLSKMLRRVGIDVLHCG